MKKLVLGCTLIICAAIGLCTLVLSGFIVCNGEGKQAWSFMQYGLAEVVRELSWLAVVIPLGLLIAGIWLVGSSFKEISENKQDKR